MSEEQGDFQDPKTTELDLGDVAAVMEKVVAQEKRNQERPREMAEYCNSHKFGKAITYATYVPLEDGQKAEGEIIELGGKPHLKRSELMGYILPQELDEEDRETAHVVVFTNGLMVRTQSRYPQDYLDNFGSSDDPYELDSIAISSSSKPEEEALRTFLGRHEHDITDRSTDDASAERFEGYLDQALTLAVERPAAERIQRRKENMKESRDRAIGVFDRHFPDASRQTSSIEPPSQP